MKRTVRVATLSAIVAGLALPTMALAAGPEDWAGLYAGLQAGYGQDDNATLKNSVGVSSNNFDITGALGGGQFGYNWAVGGMVIGVEATALAADLDGSNACLTSLFEVCGAKMEQLYTVKGRIGFPLNNFLLFATAGAASGKIEARYINSGIELKDSAYQNGWTVGLGGAMAFNNHWNAMAELQYMDFGSNSYSLGGIFPVEMENQVATLTFGVNYKF